MGAAAAFLQPLSDNSHDETVSPNIFPVKRVESKFRFGSGSRHIPVGIGLLLQASSVVVGETVSDKYSSCSIEFAPLHDFIITAVVFALTNYQRSKSCARWTRRLSSVPGQDKCLKRRSLISFQSQCDVDRVKNERADAATGRKRSFTIRMFSTLSHRHPSHKSLFFFSVSPFVNEFLGWADSGAVAQLAAADTPMQIAFRKWNSSLTPKHPT